MSGKGRLKKYLKELLGERWALGTINVWDREAIGSPSIVSLKSQDQESYRVGRRRLPSCS